MTALMRVIAGTCRSRILKSLKGLALRPTSDRLRETLFNVLAPNISGARFADLFAGTGAIGIEALSRGLRKSCSLKSSACCCAHSQKSRFTWHSFRIHRASRRCTSRPRDAGIPREGAESKFDFIFLDPPYAAAADYARVLKFLGSADLLVSGGIIVAEHRRKFDLPEIAESLRRFRVLKQAMRP